MNRALRRLVVWPAAAALVGAAGCGQSNDTDTITAIVRDIAQHPTSLCTRHATPDLLARAGGRERCLQAATSPSAQEPNLRVTGVTVTGDTARARFMGKDGPNTLTFTHAGGTWRVSNVGG